MARCVFGVPLNPPVVSVASAKAWRFALFTLSVLFLNSTLGLCQDGSQNPIGIPDMPMVENHGIDAIDLRMLTVLLNAPVRSKPGAFPFSYSLIGASNCYKQEDSDFNWYIGCGIAPSKGMNFSHAFYYGNGMLQDVNPVNYSVLATKGEAVMCPDGRTLTVKQENFVVEEPSGTMHPLPSSDYMDEQGCYNSGFTDHTIDGSGFTVVVTRDPTNAYYAALYTRDGKTTGTLVDGYDSTAFADSNGNAITGGPGTGWSDTLGLTALTKSGSPSAYNWMDVNGGAPAITQALTSTATFATNFGCSGYYGYGQSGQALSTISYPDGSNIQFTYESSGSGYYTGRIATINIPTGATITYSYSGGNNGIDCTYLVPPTMTRQTPDGTWTYQWAMTDSSKGQTTTTVLDPGKNKTIYTFTGPWNAPANSTQTPVLTRVLVYQNTGTVASPAYTLLSTDLYCYNNNFTNCADASVSYPITQKDAYHTPGGMSVSSLVETKYDGYGNTTARSVYDFGATAFTYQTTTTYGTWNGSTCSAIGNYIYDKPCDIKTINTSSQVLSESRYTYDSHGNVKTKNAWTGSTWLQSSATYNANGTIATSTDVNGAQTTYSYAPTGSGGCNGLLQTQSQITVSTGNTLTTSKTWNCDGAVPLTSTDANGNQTSFGYANSSGVADPFWRLSSTTDPMGSTTYRNYTPTSVNSHLAFGSSVVDTTTYMDGLGRPDLTQTQEGPSSGSYDSVSTTYGWNGTAFQTGTTMPCVQPQGSGCSSYFTYSVADPLTRPISIQDAGGGTVAGTYAQNDVKATLTPFPAGENAKNVQSEYDGLGRLKSTCAIMSSGGYTSCSQNSGAYSGMFTTYAYASGIGSTTVSTTRGSQTRSTIYDGLGRLTSSTTPEGGSSTNAYDSPPSYCNGQASAHPGKLISTWYFNGNYSCNQYDSLGRVIAITGNSGSGGAHICRRFYYDNSSGALGTIPSGITLANQYGRMVEAETDNCTASHNFHHDYRRVVQL